MEKTLVGYIFRWNKPEENRKGADVLCLKCKVLPEIETLYHGDPFEPLYFEDKDGGCCICGEDLTHDLVKG